MSGFRLTACNSIWIFIKTTFTHPRTPRYGGQCLSTHSGFRPLHSEVRQCSTHILTMSMRHPAYRQRRPPLDRFRIIDYDLRLLSADFTELLTLWRLHADASRSISVSASGRYSLISLIGISVLQSFRLESPSTLCVSFSLTNVSHGCRCRSLPAG